MHEPADPRAVYLASRPVHSFNDTPDRAQRLGMMQQCVNTGWERLGTAVGWDRYLSGLARFPNLSPANILLILDQQPAATRLRTHRGWLNVQRTPVARGIAILAPRVRYARHDGVPVWDVGHRVVEEVRHRPGTLFDYSSTAGAYLPPPWAQRTTAPPEGFLDDLRAAAAAVGFSVESRRDTNTGSRPVLTLIHGTSDTQKAHHLARSLGTVAGGADGAELFAYALCMANGMEVSPPQVPADPWATVTAAWTGFRRVLPRAQFRNVW